MAEKKKTIYDLGLHETLLIEEVIGKVEGTQSKEEFIKKYEVTRVPGGWVYAFDYPNFRQSPIVFVPFDNGFQPK